MIQFQQVNIKPEEKTDSIKKLCYNYYKVKELTHNTNKDNIN
jgi:hypothetical protein